LDGLVVLLEVFIEGAEKKVAFSMLRIDAIPSAE
jgi:hypothetical protein